MKLLTCFLFVLGLSIASSNALIENDATDCGAIPRVKEILDNYPNQNFEKEIVITKDPMLRFFIALNYALNVNNAYALCNGSGTMNIGFTGRNGRNYDSGIAPESISDLIDRANYQKLLEVNSSNIKVITKLSRIRQQYVKVMKDQIEKMEAQYRPRAMELVMSLSK